MNQNLRTFRLVHSTSSFVSNKTNIFFAVFSKGTKPMIYYWRTSFKVYVYLQFNTAVLNGYNGGMMSKSKVIRRRLNITEKRTKAEIKKNSIQQKKKKEKKNEKEKPKINNAKWIKKDELSWRNKNSWKKWWWRRMSVSIRINCFSSERKLKHKTVRFVWKWWKKNTVNHNQNGIITMWYKMWQVDAKSVTYRLSHIIACDPSLAVYNTRIHTKGEKKRHQKREMTHPTFHFNQVYIIFDCF